MLLIHENEGTKKQDDHCPLSSMQMSPSPPRSTYPISAVVPRLLEKCHEERAWLSAGLHLRVKAHA